MYMSISRIEGMSKTRSY